MRLIGINGRLRSGKDTAFEAIAAQLYDHRVVREAFADRLKISAAAALGVPADQAIEFCNALKVRGKLTISIDGADGEFQGGGVVTGREYLQWYGTESHRDVFGSDFWIDALLPEPSGHPSRDTRKIENLIVLEERFPDVDALVITDVRFPNEAKRIRALGGEVWRIDADQRLGPLPEDAHASERPLPDNYITKVVENNGTLGQFQANILRALF